MEMTELEQDTYESEKKIEAEFDVLADGYRVQHQKNIAITGETPDYFSEYKIADLRAFVDRSAASKSNIIDFGSGIGNSIPYFRKYFPDSNLTCSDVSSRSMEISKGRFPGEEEYVSIGDAIPIDDGSQDIVFSACVFHHIPHEEHQFWLEELLRITKPGGLLAIYEHNPMNPLTVRAVNSCPLDVNAKLIRGNKLKDRAILSGWISGKVGYKVFFPAKFSLLRPMERHLQWLCIGAQYRMTSWKRK